MLVETLSALDNVLLGAEPSWNLKACQASARVALQALMQRTGLHVRLDERVDALPVGELQRLEILKALYRGAKVLILDEPTAVLTPQETLQLFEVLRGLRAQGTTIILITHKLKEVMALCDAITVMRAGTVVHRCQAADTSEALLAEAMVGRKVALGREASVRGAADAVLLEAEALSLRSAQGVSLLNSVSLRLRPGEIVGVAGVSGNGQSELLEVLSGLQTPDSGRLRLGEQVFGADAWLHPRRARELGLAHVPEDRHACGLVLGFPAWESAGLGYQHLPKYRQGLWGLGGDALRQATQTMMDRFDVRPRNPLLGSSKFSGGNQQKLILAREIGENPKVLLVGQPTRGVDIGAIEFIHGQLRLLRDAGCAVLVVSSELDEILQLADRVLVMNGGRITGELGIEDCDERKLGLLMAAQP
jgi:general nucleoside transport system ATP-binding protein